MRAPAAGLIRTVLLSTALLLGTAACGQATSLAQSSSGGAKASNQMVAYASCMRSHGIPKFPDPTSSSGGSQLGPHGKGIMIKTNGTTMSFDLSGIDTSSAQFTSAQKSCASKLGILGGPAGSGSSSPKMQQAALQFSACMRDHGVPNFPDPTFGGSGPSGDRAGGLVLSVNGATFHMAGTGLNPQSSQFQAAFGSCKAVLRQAMGGGSSASGSGQ